MTTDIFSHLAALRAFLTDDLAGQVPAQWRAEVRAAGKVLREIALEIDALPALLRRESAQMLTLCEQAVAEESAPELQSVLADARRQHSEPQESLRRQIGLHTALQTLMSDCLAVLQMRFDGLPKNAPERTTTGERIAGIYRLLADQAKARMAWQSVFEPIDKTADKGD